MPRWSTRIVIEPTEPAGGLDEDGKSNSQASRIRRCHGGWHNRDRIPFTFRTISVDRRLQPRRYGDDGSRYIELGRSTFLQHSGMVRNSFRAWLNRVVPEYCHGVIYTIASGVALLLLAVCWQPSTVNVYALEGAGRWLMRGVLLLCLGGVLWGMRLLEEFDAFGFQAFLSRVRNEQRHPAKLSIVGPYPLVRHPFYAFGMVALWVTPVLSLDRLLLNVLFTAWIVFGATLEERDLLEEFGEAYKDYQRAVPMFVPGGPTQRGGE